MSERILGGRYALGEPIGRGGMAVVWHATDRTLGRHVAVKTLDLTGPDRDVAAARFEREARATASLNHPNIVTVFDTGVDENTAYLVMELLEGPTLARQIATTGPLPIDQVQTLARQVLAAMQAADARGIVHRDIKPGNIAFGRDGQAKVLDFGITQLLDDTAGQALTKTNTIVGTAEYLSPEQATGGAVDTRADLYAVGCVLYNALTGQPPFRGATQVATLMMHVNEPAPDVRALRPDTPPTLAALVSSLMAKDPSARPATATAALAVLSGAVAPPAGVATEVMPAQTQVLPPASRPAQTAGLPVVTEPTPSRAGRWILGVIALLLLAGAGYYLVTKNQQQPTGGPTQSTTPVVTTTSAESTPTSATTTSEATTSTSAPPTTTTTSQTTPPPTTSTSAPSTDTAREAVAAALTKLRAAVAAGSGDGGIDEDATSDLTSQMDAVEDAIPEKAKDVQDAVDELGQLMQDRTADGSISAPAATQLVGPYAELKAAAEQVKNGNG